MCARFVLLVLGVLAFIPVVGLAGFHIGLVALGRTTNEHVRWCVCVCVCVVCVCVCVCVCVIGVRVYTGPRYSSLFQVTGKFRSYHNPYNKGCCGNCWSVLCSPKKPR